MITTTMITAAASSPICTITGSSIVGGGVIGRNDTPGGKARQVRAEAVRRSRYRIKGGHAKLAYARVPVDAPGRCGGSPRLAAPVELEAEGSASLRALATPCRAYLFRSLCAGWPSP